MEEEFKVEEIGKKEEEMGDEGIYLGDVLEELDKC